MKKITFTFLLFLFLLSSSSNGQQALELFSCVSEEFEINDHSDADDDGNVCEAKIILTNSAFYSDNAICAISDIKWSVIIDLYGDGTDDLEYSSSLPSDDNTLDDTNDNGIPDLYIPMTISGETQSIQLPDIEEPMSNHNVRWSVSDDCDLADLCVVNFSVVDKKAPTPFCVSLWTFTLSEMENEIHAKDFVVGVFDNCTDLENIRYSFSGDSIVPVKTVGCEDVLNSPALVDIYVWDETDNANYCTIFLTVIPTPDADCFVEGEIAGFVRTWEGKPLAGVKIRLDADLPEYPFETISNKAGKYSFGVHPAGFNYRLSALDDEDHLEEVSTLDFVMIIRNILGIKPFINPYQIIAADINGDYKVKANDLAILKNLILGVITKYPSNTSWKFIDEKFEFENPANPFPDLIDAQDDPFVIEINQINNMGHNFIGIKIGDVSSY